MNVPGLSPFFDFLLTHVGKRKHVIMNVIGAEVECLCHGQALGWADHGAQPAETTLAHVNVEFRGVDTFGGAVRGLSKFHG